jgi:hypothetical protein
MAELSLFINPEWTMLTHGPLCRVWHTLVISGELQNSVQALP